jgi:hypothetical protein
VAGTPNGTDGESEPESRSVVLEVKYQYEGIRNSAIQGEREDRSPPKSELSAWTS